MQREHLGALQVGGEATLRDSHSADGGGGGLQAFEIYMQHQPVVVIGVVAVSETGIEIQRRLAMDAVAVAVHRVGGASGVADVDGTHAGVFADAAMDRAGVAGGEGELAGLGGAGPVQEGICPGIPGSKLQQREVLGQLGRQSLGINVHNRLLVVKHQR